MNILFHEWKSSLKNTILWAFFLVFFVVSMLLEFSAYYENPEMNAILDTMPKALLEAFGMEGANLTTVIGYVSVTVVFLYIMLGIHGALSGSGILSKEERDKTAEFLMVLPIRRERVLLFKFLAVFGNVVLLNLFTGALLFFGTAGYDRGPDFNRFLTLVMAAAFLLQLFFLSLGFFLASASRRYKRSGALSVGILFFLYILSIFTELSDGLSWMKHVTPFKYFEAAQIQLTLALSSLHMGLILGLVLLFLFGAYQIYPRRDLKL